MALILELPHESAQLLLTNPSMVGQIGSAGWTGNSKGYCGM